jgi:hypothetical protein
MERAKEGIGKKKKIEWPEKSKKCRYEHQDDVQIIDSVGALFARHFLKNWNSL